MPRAGTATAAAAGAHPNGRNPGDVWSIPTRPYRGPHFAAFPIDIPTRCIQAGCKPGGMVLDPFCGTGTTGLAALALGRRFTGIDLNPAFAALAAERLRQAARPSRTAAATSGTTGSERHRSRRPACRRADCNRQATVRPAQHPPKRAPERTIAGPEQGRAGPAPRRSVTAHQPRHVRVVLPDEPPRLTPAAARALLRILLKARAPAQGDRQTTDQDETERPQP